MSLESFCYSKSANVVKIRVEKFNFQMSSGSGRRSRSRLGAVEYEDPDVALKDDPDIYDVHEAQRLK